jgi:hypothetical protein
MAKLEKVRGNTKCLSVLDYIELIHKGNLTVPAIDYAIKQGWIDYIQPSRDRYIVLTKRTLNYKPRNDKSRNDGTGTTN